LEWLRAIDGKNPRDEAGRIAASAAAPQTDTVVMLTGLTITGTPPAYLSHRGRDKKSQ
jgi:hypothetical protein